MEQRLAHTVRQKEGGHMRTSFGYAICAVFLSVVLAVPVLAQESTRRFVFGNDVFAAGSDVRITGDAQDVFAAGETVTLDSNIGQSAYLVGRTVRVTRAVGGTLHAAGYDVDIAGAVAGDVIAAGYRVEIAPAAAVAADVLAAGRNVFVRGAVMGNALLTGQTVEIAGLISGNVQIRARTIRFGDGGRIDGTLEYWSEDDIAIPAGVIAADRVIAHRIEPSSARSMPFAAFVIGGLVFLAFCLVIMSILAFVLAKPLARAREALAARPWRALALGAIVVSALLGGIFVLAVSLVGIPLVPLLILLIPLTLFVSYVTAAHAAGALLVTRARRAETTSGFIALAAMFVGLVILVLVGAIPILGWVVCVFAVWLGLGAWIALWMSSGQAVPAASRS